MKYRIYRVVHKWDCASHGARTYGKLSLLIGDNGKEEAIRRDVVDMMTVKEWQGGSYTG